MSFSTSVFYMAIFGSVTDPSRQPQTTRGSLWRQCDI
jgi:hypothetical protein